MHHKFRNLSGQTFGMLTAMHPEESIKGAWKWRFLCACGKQCVKDGAEATRAVKMGHLPNCGCARILHLSQARQRHGMTKHPAYICWRNMRNRCHKEWEPAYKNYGARGIAVCKRWDACFENFWEDMGPSYITGLTLERRENNKGYTPDNCHWATRTQQMNNTRKTIRSVNVSELCARTGLKRTTIYYRLKHGWPVAALEQPPSFDNRNRYMTS